MTTATCKAMFEQVENPRDTHTCALPVPHTEPHRCPVCGAKWTFDGVIREP